MTQILNYLKDEVGAKSNIIIAGDFNLKDSSVEYTNFCQMLPKNMKDVYFECIIFINYKIS